MTSKSNQALISALRTDENTLLAAIAWCAIMSGEIIPPLETSESLEKHKEEFYKCGKQWFDNFAMKYKRTICQDTRLTSLVKAGGKKQDGQWFSKFFIKYKGVKRQDLESGLLILDVIDGLTRGVPAFYVSALIVKRGIRSFCSS